MPSPFGHLAAGAAAGVAIAGPVSRNAIVLFAVAGAIPDADLIYGVHRGPSHSIGAAAIAGGIGWLIWRPRSARDREPGARIRFAVGVAVAYATHVLLDYLSHDSRPPFGLMALWPFTTEFYQAPYYLFLAINRRYWTMRAWSGNLVAFTREVLILGPLVWLAWWFRRR